MAKRIKGITIELDGNTTGLDRALQGVNQRSRDLQSELSDVQRLLRFNPGNVELLEQQQRLLSEQVENTAQKLQQLKQVQGQVQAQFERGDIGEEQYRAFQREVIATEGRLEHFQNQLRETESQLNETGNDVEDLGERFQNAGEKMKTAGEGIKNVGAGLTAGVTAPLLGIGAAALKAADDFDSAAGRLQAQLGLTEDQSKELEQVAKNLWKNAFGENIQEASDSVAIIYQQLGNLPASEIESAAEAAYTLSDAFGVDIKESTRAAGQLMQQFGVDSQTAFDLITAGFQRGGDYSDEFLDTITEYSTQFANLGFTAEQALGLLVSGAESGIFSVDKLADTVKESFLQITDGGDNTRDALKELGLEASQIENDIASGGDKANAAFLAVMTAIAGVTNEADRTRLAVELMGTPIEDLGPQYQAFFATATDGMTGFEGAAKEAADTLYDNFGSRLTTTLRTLQESLRPIGETILDMVESVLPYIESLANSFAGLSPHMQQIILIIGGIVGAIGPLLVIIGTLITSVGSILGVLGGLATSLGITGGAAGLFSAAIGALTGPIGIIVAAIVGLIAILVSLYKNNEDFRVKVQEIWEDIKTFFSTAMDFIGNKVVKPIMIEILSFFSEILGKIKGFWDENGKQITEIAKGFLAFISAEVKEKMGLIKGIFEVVWPIISGAVQIAWGIIKTSTKNTIDLIIGIIQLALKLLKGDWEGAWETIKQTATSIMDNIISFFEDIDLYKIGSDIIQGLINGIGSMGRAIKTKVQELASLIPDGLKDFLGIASPSKLTEQLGEFTGEGFALGIENMARRVRLASDQLAKASLPIPDQGASTSSGRVQEITQNITINSPSPLSPREIARKNLQASRVMAQELIQLV